MNGVNAEILNLTEFKYDDADIPTGNLRLDISPDDKIHYQELYADPELKDGVLTLVNYYGKILVPKHVGINIMNTSKSIDGIIASPTNIESSGQINLNILKNSHLDLCLIASGSLSINGKIEHHDNETVHTHGQDFEHFKGLYSLIPNIPNNGDAFYNINVCMHYNLVNICNDSKSVDLEYYDIHKQGMTEASSHTEILLHEKRIAVLRLRREITHAVLAEDYTRAALVKKELQEELHALQNNILNDIQSKN